MLASAHGMGLILVVFFAAILEQAARLQNEFWT
jgi:hypothetical protein